MRSAARPRWPSLPTLPTMPRERWIVKSIVFMKTIDIIYRMNLRDLEYLVAVADQRHFGKAAEACHVSQPTLSMQIRKLEEELGVPLLERTNKQVIVTPVGEKVLARAREALREAEAIREIAKTAHDPFAGELKLGAFPT